MHHQDVQSRHTLCTGLVLITTFLHLGLGMYGWDGSQGHSQNRPGRTVAHQKLCNANI